MREFFVGVLGGPLKPFIAFFGGAGQTELTVQFGCAETVHRAGVESYSRFPEESVSAK
jgi:hypothetical protein